MYKIAVQSNPVLFISALAAGIAAAIYLPHVYPGLMVEIPLSALYVGEAGLALLCTLLFYENAAPGQVIKLASWVLGFSMTVGAIGNFVGQTTQFLPEDQVLISWIELLIMNVAGLLSTLTLFQLLPPDSVLVAQAKAAARVAASGKAATAATATAAVDESEIPDSEPSTVSVKDILEQLDVSRINRLEKSLHPEDVSLEALFKEESKAARLAGAGGVEPKAITGPVAGAEIQTTPDSKSELSDPADFSQMGEMLDQFAQVKETNSSGQRTEFRDILQDLQRDLAGTGTDSGSGRSEPQAVMSRFQQLLQGNLPDDDIALPAASPVEPELGLAESDEIAADIDDAFSKMLPQSAQRDCNQQELEKLKESRILEASESDDEVLELSADEDEPQSAVEEDEVAEPLPKPAKDTKEFGRLSGSFPTAQEDEAVGSMKTIGKMLLDARAVENIIKAGDRPRNGLTTARILSVEHGENLDKLLLRINSFPGIEGSIIIGQDGLIIAGRVDDSLDKELLGNMSLAIQSNTHQVCGKLDLGGLHQVVLQSQDKTAVLTTLEHGVLCVFSSRRQGINGLLKSIQAAATVQGHDAGNAPQPAIELQPVEAPVVDRLLPAVIEAVKDEDALPVPEQAAQPADAPVSAQPVSADQVKNLIESLVQSQRCPQIAVPLPIDEVSESTLEQEDEPQTAPAADELLPKLAAAAEAPAKEVKEFGRLAISGSHPVDLQATTGSMKTIGKMLIDAQAISNIIKSGEQAKTRGLTTARVISAARGEGIKALLGKIDNYPGVSGSLIVGHDGLVIASTVSTDVDKDVWGAMTSAIHSNTQLATRKLELGKLKQAIMQSHDKLTVLTDVEVGILAVFCELQEMDKIDGLMAAIENTISS